MKNKNIKNKKKRLISFQVKTITKCAELIFLTKAVNGREALKGMIKNSCDFNRMLRKRESNYITINVKVIK